MKPRLTIPQTVRKDIDCSTRKTTGTKLGEARELEFLIDRTAQGLKNERARA